MFNKTNRLYGSKTYKKNNNICTIKKQKQKTTSLNYKT